MITEFITLFLVGSFIGGLVSRFLFRFSTGHKLMDFKINLSTATNRKFRLVELVPVLGAVLTHIKHKNKNDNLAVSTIYVELLGGITLYLIISLVTYLPLIMLMVIWSYVFVGFMYYNIIDKEMNTLTDDDFIVDESISKIKVEQGNLIKPFYKGRIVTPMRSGNR